MRDEIRLADGELRRFILYQHQDAARHSYPTQAAFAKDIARGTISTPPTPDDPVMDAVGRFYWSILEIERRAAAERYMRDPEHIRARRLGQTVHQFRRMQDRVLLKLAGFLMAGVFSHK